MTEIGKKIRDFIVENFLFGDDSRLGERTSLIDEGIIDSTGVLELVNFLEEEFGLKMPDEDLIPENLDSILNAENYVRRRTLRVRGPEAISPALHLGP